MSLRASSKLSRAVGLTFQARVAQPIFIFFGVWEVWPLSTGRAAAPRASAAAFAKSRRSNAEVMMCFLLLLLRSGFRTGCCVGFQVAKDELYSRQHHLLH